MSLLNQKPDFSFFASPEVNAYESLGDYEKAIDHHEKPLAISREIKHLSGEAGSLNNIGNAYRQLQQTEKAIDNYRDCLKIAIPETIAIRQAQFELRTLTGDELSAEYKRQLEDYFEQQEWGENKAEIIKNVRVRLDLLCRETLPFVSPYYWSGFVSQGLA